MMQPPVRRGVRELFGATVAITAAWGACAFLMSVPTLYPILGRFSPIGRYVLLPALLYAARTALAERRGAQPLPLCRLASGRGVADWYWPALALSIVAGTLPVFVAWGGGGVGAHGNGAIWGAIPISDANGYYQGAGYLLDTGTLNGWSHRRPINAAWFATRLTVTGGHFRYALLLQAALCGAALFSAADALTRTHGRSAGFVLFAVCYAYAAIFLPSTLSEMLGLTLGLLGFSLIWGGAAAVRPMPFAIGMWLLTLASLVRPGALFVLPALVIAAAWLFRRGGRVCWSASAMAGGAVLAGWAVNAALLRGYGDGSGVALGNFSYVLYGIAAGGKRWDHVLTVHPELAAMPEAAASTFIYARALELMRHEPWGTLTGIVKNSGYGFAAFGWQLVTEVLAQNGYGIGMTSLRRLSAGSALALLSTALVVTGALIWGGFRWLRAASLQPPREVGVLLAFSLGFVCSLPIFYLEGGIRLTAASFPFIAVLVALATLGWRRAPMLPPKASGVEPSGRELWFPAVLGGLIAAGALIGPALGRHLSEAVPRTSGLPCSGGQERITVRLGPGAAFLNITKDDGFPSAVPTVRRSALFDSDHSTEMVPLWKALPVPSTLMTGYDPITKRSRQVVGPLGFVEETHGYATLCGSSIEAGSFELWRVQ